MQALEVGKAALSGDINAVTGLLRPKAEEEEDSEDDEKTKAKQESEDDQLVGRGEEKVVFTLELVGKKARDLAALHRDPRLFLLIPLFFYSGYEQAFATGDFAKEVWANPSYIIVHYHPHVSAWNVDDDDDGAGGEDAPGPVVDRVRVRVVLPRDDPVLSPARPPVGHRRPPTLPGRRRRVPRALLPLLRPPVAVGLGARGGHQPAPAERLRRHHPAQRGRQLLHHAAAHPHVRLLHRQHRCVRLACLVSCRVVLHAW